MMLHSELVYVKRIKGKGRGVFARQLIRKGEVIERVPVIIVPNDHFADGLKNPTLSRYCFIRTRTTVAVALGFGSLYNHSYRPNARYDDGPVATMFFTALRDIAPDEEITVNYNGVPNDRSPMIFEVR